MPLPGAEVFLAATAYVTDPMAHSAEAAGCRQHDGEGWASALLLAEDGTALRGAVLIDDKPQITEWMTPLWERIVFDREYNRQVLGTRIHDWTDPRTMEVIAETTEARMRALAAG